MFLNLTYIPRLTIILVICLSVAGCASTKLVRDGDMLASQGRWDEALDQYDKALETSPDNTGFRIKVIETKYKASLAHIKKGEALLQKEDYDRAILEFQIATALNPSIKRSEYLAMEAKKRKDAAYYYKAGLDFLKQKKTVEAKAALKRALSLNANLEGAAEELERLEQDKKTILGGYELNLKSEKPITLKFKDTPVKDIFDIISKLSGINFIFDEGVKKQKASLYIEQATFGQALDLVLMTNQLFQKVVNENTIIIIPDTKSKRQQYEDLMIHTFSLSNLEAKKAVNLLRTLLKIKSIYVNEELNTIVVRDTPEVVSLAEKLLRANDLTDAEVMLEVEILEVGNTDTEKLGLDLQPDEITAGLRDVGSKELTYGFLKGASSADILFTIPDIAIDLQKQSGNVTTLANPKIRVANNKKAKIHIGERIPIITVTTSGADNVTENVQYVDVGVKLNVEPVIHLDNEVTLKITLEISTLGEQVAASKSTVFRIGTRNAETELRLHDGETQIMGGLIKDEERETTVKVPFLGDIPILGRLFSSVSDSANKSEILLSITPHIVRTREVADEGVTSIWSGREQEFSDRSPFESFEEQGPDVDLPEPVTQIFGGVGRAAAAEEAQAEEGEPEVIPPASGDSAVISIAGPASAAVDDEIDLSINISSSQKVVSVPFYVRYDPVFLEFTKATEGTFMKMDGKSATFMTSNDATKGRLIVGNSRLGDRDGISGQGDLMSVRFKARKNGSTNVYLENYRVTDGSGKVVPAIVSGKDLEIK
ncbi:MAG: cohesin domain-containing protein [bacterium]|nr:cohesin domain-containing protein [bacterium]